MKRTKLTKSNLRTGKRAVVIGSGIAGLTAARVLADHFDLVTIIDRDTLPDAPAFRAGIPQAHHAHTLLPYGQQLLEQMFPGLANRLVAKGALCIDDNVETAYIEDGLWRKPEPRASRLSISVSRPVLENIIYRLVTASEKVSVLQGYEAAGLLTDDRRTRVTGVSVRSRQERGGGRQALEADLVVDASGRNSKTPQWLAGLGFPAPEEWQIDARAGYASRIYRRPARAGQNWKKLYISPSPPDGLRGGVIIPLEGQRWHVTLIGLNGDYPPTDEQGFLAFARSLPSPELYDAICAAEPLSRVTGYRSNANRVRRYECLPRYLEGLVVLGDAVFTMNPVYALGMTAAAVSSRTLDDVLSEPRFRGDLTGLAQAFQRRLAGSINVLWQQAVRNDWRWPATEISDNTEDLYAPDYNAGLAAPAFAFG